MGFFSGNSLVTKPTTRSDDVVHTSGVGWLESITSKMWTEGISAFKCLNIFLINPGKTKSEANLYYTL